MDTAKQVSGSRTEISWLGKKVTKFYLDEPIHHGTLDLLVEASEYALSIGCRVYTSESDGAEEWSNPWSSNVLRLASFIRQEIPPAQWPFVGNHTYFHQGGVFGADPRTQWDYLREQLGAYFNFVWIRLRQEQTSEEIGLLFGHANNMGGINRMFYGFWDSEPGWPSGSDHRLPQASDQAHRYSWLQQLEKETEESWCCETQTFDPYTCDLESSSYTGNERWV